MPITGLFSETRKHSVSPNSSSHLHKVTRSSRASNKGFNNQYLHSNLASRRARQRHNNLSRLHRRNNSDNRKRSREVWVPSLQLEMRERRLFPVEMWERHLSPGPDLSAWPQIAMKNP